MSLLRSEPAVLITLLGTIIVAIAQQIVGSGIVTGNGLNVLNAIIAVIPVIAGIITRQLVTPATTTAAGSAD